MHALQVAPVSPFEPLPAEWAQHCVGLVLAAARLAVAASPECRTALGRLINLCQDCTPSAQHAAAAFMRTADHAAATLVEDLVLHLKADRA